MKNSWSYIKGFLPFIVVFALCAAQCEERKPGPPPPPSQGATTAPEGAVAPSTGSTNTQMPQNGAGMTPAPAPGATAKPVGDSKMPPSSAMKKGAEPPPAVQQGSAPNQGQVDSIKAAQEKLRAQKKGKGG